MNKRDFEICMAINDDGDASVSLEKASTARESLVQDYGGACVRVVQLRVSMALPEVEEVDVEVPDEVGQTQQVEAEAA
jgi:hypothetical protein